ncbi:Cof-type HAD-IIB family hydrolase [Neobacillus thermocopriae]|uniref:HAD family phosphatase n=1 Tax=Neobacillus thermocopriae TaxID=1215031 RepID=A0A6B3TPP4_9BACI|nr:Cof-type HAD-IIB family hydrolase [Neobacillus thermocopriae]MED3624980.1 Cof-type HAD-IIB family hydrolase [Neobacillus thermocopriae]MED3713250.1 Cof-type HAD-IIB family hydrolase [Neobacillus thermocopriae]NEX78309.1 HAD family phosphatase [Neobacillus thermocopriae]
MIKCIATDMDGTLLNSMQQISEENKAAILKAQKAGVEVVVATGRSYQEATYVLNKKGITCPIICVNGAEVRSKEGEVISATPISKQVAREVAAKLEEMDIYFEVYTDKGTYSVDLEKAVSILVDIVVTANPEVDPEFVRQKAEARRRDGLVHPIDDYETLFNNDEFRIYKFLAFSFDMDKLKAASESLKELEDLNVTKSGVENIEITHRNAQKGIALEAFVNARGISLSETMAIGDNFNDVSMFEKAGRAVAMGNASPGIKSLCDWVTDTNDESGVGKAILEVL